MRYVHRELEKEIFKACRAFPSIILTGPRRSGKTTLLRTMFPRARYILLEDPALVARFRSDPAGFVAELEPQAILDEIQNVPEVLNHLRARIDMDPRHRKGQWLITGSQEAGLMKGVTESMAGRAAVFHLLPLSLAEDERVTPFRGGFPEVIGRPAMAATWFRSYVETYLERDVRAVSLIGDLGTFRRLLTLLATRVGQVLNRTALAAPLGVSVPTVAAWIDILEVTGQVILLPPFYENFGKRMIKSPKLYFVDSGLICHLLGIEAASELERSPFLGSIFESFVASEIVKHQINAGRRRELYWFRDQQGLEVDFLVPGPSRRLLMLEAKASANPDPSTAVPLRKLTAAAGAKPLKAGVVYRNRRGADEWRALAPDVSAVPVTSLGRFLDG